MTSDPRPPLDAFDEADREIVAALRSADPEVRAVAFDDVSDVVNDDLAHELLRFARDPDNDDEERGAALIALGPSLETCSYDEREDGSLPEPTPGEPWLELPLSPDVYREVTEELRRLYHDGGLPKLVRRRALEAAVRAPRDWHAEAAAAAWRADDPEWRLTAVFAMGLLRGFGEEITEAFGSDDQLLRGEAIRAAGHAGVEALGPRILALAADETTATDERLVAIDALAELAPGGAVELLEELTDDDDPTIAETADAALEDLLLLSDLGTGEDADFDDEL